MPRAVRRSAPASPAAVAALLAISLLALPGSVGAQTEALDLSDATIADLGASTTTLVATAAQPVQSITVAIAYDPGLLVAVSVDPVGAALAAEGVFSSILPVAGGVIAAVIADAEPPFDGTTLPALAAEPILEIAWSPAVLVAAATPASLVFLDGTFDNPPVTNTITLDGGIAVTQAQGLVLDGATVTILPPAAPALAVGAVSLPPGVAGDIPLLLENPTGPVSAFTIAVPRPPELEFLAVLTAGSVVESLAAELVAVELDTSGAVLDVVLDAVAPFAGQTIPVGAAIPIGWVRARCSAPPLGPAPDLALPLAPADGVVGTGPAVNRVAFGALEVAPALVAGTVTCEAVPLAPYAFLAGVLEPGGAIGPASSAPGDTATIGFWYTDPTGLIEGIQLAACAPCAAGFVPGSFSEIGSVLSEAEFLLATYDADPDDGDGCELTVGALLDSLPPFDGATLPATTEPLLLGTVDLAISPDALPFECFAVEFCDGIDGGGGAAIENIAVVGGESIFNFAKLAGEVCLDDGIPFRRGDANDDGRIDLADPIATIVAVLGAGAALVCPAAADADGGGTLDIADAVLLLAHLYAGGPAPAAPYPGCAPMPGEECPGFAGCP